MKLMCIDEAMGVLETVLSDALVHFLFTAKWKNGVTKQEIIRVNIVNDVFQAFDFYRSN